MVKPESRFKRLETEIMLEADLCSELVEHEDFNLSDFVNEALRIYMLTHGMTGDIVFDETQEVEQMYLSKFCKKEDSISLAYV